MVGKGFRKVELQDSQTFQTKQPIEMNSFIFSLARSKLHIDLVDQISCMSEDA